MTRTWTDTNRHFVPGLRSAEPGAAVTPATSAARSATPNFGKPLFTNNLDPATLAAAGASVRATGRFGVSVQQELLPRVSVEVGYYRRWLTHLQRRRQRRHDKLADATTTRFSVTAPIGPAAAGRRRAGDLRPVQRQPDVASLVNNVTTWPSNFGDEYSRYNGVLVNVSARTRNGITFQGGSTPARRSPTTATSARIFPETVAADADPDNP